MDPINHSQLSKYLGIIYLELYSNRLSLCSLSKYVALQGRWWSYVWAQQITPIFEGGRIPKFSRRGLPRRKKTVASEPWWCRHLLLTWYDVTGDMCVKDPSHFLNRYVPSPQSSSCITHGDRCVVNDASSLFCLAFFSFLKFSSPLFLAKFQGNFRSMRPFLLFLRQCRFLKIHGLLLTAPEHGPTFPPCRI